MCPTAVFCNSDRFGSWLHSKGRVDIRHARVDVPLLSMTATHGQGMLALLEGMSGLFGSNVYTDGQAGMDCEYSLHRSLLHACHENTRAEMRRSFPSSSTLATRMDDDMIFT